MTERRLVRVLNHDGLFVSIQAGHTTYAISLFTRERIHATDIVLDLGPLWDSDPLPLDIERELDYLENWEDSCAYQVWPGTFSDPPEYCENERKFASKYCATHEEIGEA